MHFGLFFGGLTMLVGSCVIVCVCKKCKRRAVRKKLGKNCEMRPPTVSLTIDKNAETAAYLNSIRITDSPMLTKILSQDSPKSRTSSKDSCDSSKGLLGLDSNTSPNRLEVPTLSSDWVKRSGTIRVIPAIYIDTVVCTSSVA